MTTKNEEMLVLLGIIILSCSPSTHAHCPMWELYESPPPKSIPCEHVTQYYVSPPPNSIPHDSSQEYASPTPQSRLDERDAIPNGFEGLPTQHSTNLNRPSSFSSRIGFILHDRLKEQAKNDVAEDLSRRLEADGTYHELSEVELAAYALQADSNSREHPSMRSSNASSSSGWKKNRTNKEKDEDLEDPRSV